MPHSVQRTLELGAKQAVVAFNAFRAADHHMVGTGEALDWHDLAGERAETALHTIANDSAADLLGDRKADANGGIRIFPIANQQDEARRRCALAGIGGNEISALLDDC